MPDPSLPLHPQRFFLRVIRQIGNEKDAGDGYSGKHKYAVQAFVPPSDRGKSCCKQEHTRRVEKCVEVRKNTVVEHAYQRAEITRSISREGR